jgi:glycosyltransferase involved in cell wall biosynthesis
MSDVVRILHFGPHDENDGIARYQEQYMKALNASPHAESVIFAVSPTEFRTLSAAEQGLVLRRLKKELAEYDILHIQHEFGLFSPGDFQKIIATAQQAHKRVVVSLHTSPVLAIKPAKLGGLGPRSMVMYLRRRRYYKRMLTWHIDPLKIVDAVLVHDESTASYTRQYGVAPERIHVLPHPVYDFPEPPKSTLIAEKLQRKDGDIIYCTVGMMHRYKGIYDAIRALKFLPANHKLAIIGGVHPLSEDIPMYNKACDLIDTLGLQDRVFITGFVEDDNIFNALIRECDICVYPYDGKYYAHVSSGAINLAFSNHMPVIAYPTVTFTELSAASEQAVVLTQTFAYYELAREIQRVDVEKQVSLSRSYAVKMAWPKVAEDLVKIYQSFL